MSWAELFSSAPTFSWPWSGQSSENVQEAETRESYVDWYRGTIPASWTIPEHVKLISEALDAVDRGEVDRLAIHMPPRHGKSETFTVRYPLRFLEREPEQNVLVTGYNERFARKFGRRTRNLAAARGLVSADKAASDEWATTTGGLYMARGVGSPPTGTGFRRIVIDDPIRRRQDAESEAYRDMSWDWYSEDIYSRLEPGGAIILVCTLWHPDDVAARAIKSEPGRWRVLKLPAISDEGLALWPDRYSIDDLIRIRSVMGEYGFDALYQQNPTPRQGSFFKVGELKIVDRIPEGLPNCLSFDNASSDDEDADWTAGIHLHGPDSDGYYYVDPWRIQAEPSERNKAMKRRAELLNPQYVTIPKDPAAAGKEVAQNHIKMFAGFSVTAVPRRKGETKLLVADPFAAQVNAGNIRVYKGPNDAYVAGDRERSFAADYIEELRQFPNGKNDDMVDASADAFNRLTGKKPGAWDW